jgi:hypothetical protein
LYCVFVIGVVISGYALGFSCGGCFMGGRIEWMYLDCWFSFGSGVARLILVQQYSTIIPLFVLL